MKNIKNRIITILCVVTVTLAQIEIFNFNNLVFADEKSEKKQLDLVSNTDLSLVDLDGALTYGDFKYVILDSYITIIDYNGNAQNIVVPSKIDGIEVTNIGAYAFAECTSIKSIQIPDSVKSIGGYAFYECTNLTRIQLSRNIASIDNYTFYNCKSLTKIELPDNIRSIGNYAFHYCKNLINIELPDNINSIGNYAFYYCSNLKNILFPKNLTSIGYNAFSYCSCLNNIELPNGITSISDNTFYYCSNLKSIVLPDSITSIGNFTFSDCKSLTSIELPKNLTSLGACAFYECSNLTNIKIPDSITDIKNGTFHGCNNMVSIIIPYTVTSISSNAFEYCSGLIIYGYAGSYAETYANENNIPFIQTKGVYEDFKYIISDSKITLTNYTGEDSYGIYMPYEINGMKVTGIGNSLFYGYKEVEEIDMPNTITNIGNDAFNGCISLRYIQIPDSVESIGNYTFNDCISFEKIEIPDSVVKIGKSAFEGCSNLTNVELSKNLVSIEEGTFYGCRKLEKIEIPDSVESIGEYAFSNCSSLKKIKISNSVKNIADNAFSDCSGLSIYGYEGSYAESYAKEKNINFINLYDDFEYIVSNSTVSIVGYNGNYEHIIVPKKINGMQVNCISDSAFKNYKSLISIQIPNGVENIGESAFSGCSSLINVNLPETITNIKKDAFSGCSNLKEIELPKSIKTIEYSAFSGCSSLEKINIPEGVTNIKNNAFSGCSNLININLPETITNITNGAFKDCVNLKEIELPNGMESIGVDVFNGCSSLKKINIPKTIIYIDYGAFKDCVSLKEIELPNSIKIIGDSAFSGCSGLKEIEIPNSVEKIGYYAFKNCSSLISIKIQSGSISIDDDVFDEGNNLTIYADKYSAANYYAYSHRLKFIAFEDILRVIFNYEDGRDNIEKEVIRNNSIEDLPNDTDREGYIFIGWSTEKGNKDKIVDLNSSYKIKENITFYAIWKKINNIENTFVENFCVLRNSSSSLVISWNEVKGADGYEIFKAIGETEKYEKIKTITNNNTLTSTSTGLESATSYYYKIRAYKENNGQKVYGEFTLLKATTNPDKVTGLKMINNTESSLRIGWDKYDKATGYEIFRATSENGKYVRVNTITDNNITQSASPYLQSGKTYYYRVKAYLVVDGEKLYSNSATLQAKTKSFGSITGLKMVASTENSIRISWNCVNDVEGYEVFRSTSEDGKYVKVKTITDNNVTSTASPNLESATTYYYKVRSYKTIDGNKQYGDFSIVKTSTKPKAVDNLVLINLTEKSIKIAWGEVKGADGYEIFKSTGDNEKYIKVGTTSDLNYLSLGVVKGQSYCYKVKAYKVIDNKKVYGEYSKIIEITVK